MKISKVGIQTVVLNVWVSKCAPEEKQECSSLERNLDLTHHRIIFFFGQVWFWYLNICSQECKTRAITTLRYHKLWVGLHFTSIPWNRLTCEIFCNSDLISDNSLDYGSCGWGVWNNFFSMIWRLWNFLVLVISAGEVVGRIIAIICFWSLEATDSQRSSIIMTGQYDLGSFSTDEAWEMSVGALDNSLLKFSGQWALWMELLTRRSV